MSRAELEAAFAFYIWLAFIVIVIGGAYLFVFKGAL